VFIRLQTTIQYSISSQEPCIQTIKEYSAKAGELKGQEHLSSYHSDKDKVKDKEPESTESFPCPDAENFHCKKAFPHPDIASVHAEMAHSFDRICPAPNRRYMQSTVGHRAGCIRIGRCISSRDISKLFNPPLPNLNGSCSKELRGSYGQILASSSIRQE
jgi:hypothetical protein